MLFYTVPNSPPQNFQGTAVSSRSISLNWDSPLLEDQNGIIIGYIINVTLVETEENFNLFSNSNNITVGLLRPYSTYRLKIAGQTVVGIGTFSVAITIRTPEDGKSTLPYCCDSFAHHASFFNARYFHFFYLQFHLNLRIQVLRPLLALQQNY